MYRKTKLYIVKNKCLCSSINHYIRPNFCVACCIRSHTVRYTVRQWRVYLRSKVSIAYRIKILPFHIKVSLFSKELLKLIVCSILDFCNLSLNEFKHSVCSSLFRPLVTTRRKMKSINLNYAN